MALDAGDGVDDDAFAATRDFWLEVNAEDIEPGAEVETVLAEGRLRARVLEAEAKEPDA